MERKAVILDESGVRRAVTRIAYEILERNHGAENLYLMGIVTGGVILGQRIAQKIEEIEHVAVPLFPLDITSYRDDRDPKSPEKPAQPFDSDFSVQDKRVILVDDVLYTGRSCRAAIDAIFTRGRPDRVQLAVLIDRGHRELPIRPDYIGKNVPTAQTETVRVLWREFNGEDSVGIYQEERGKK